MQAGIRTERTKTEINNENENSYACFLPGFNANYKINGKQSVKFSYRRSITRPNAGNLNPLPNVIDSITISLGNPYLKPAYFHNLKLTYSLSIGEKYFISPELYLTAASDYFQSVTTINKQNISETTYKNAGKGYELGFQVSGSLKPHNWLMINTFLKAYNLQTNPDQSITQNRIKERNYYGYYASVSVSMNLKNDFSVNLSYQQNSATIDIQNSYWQSPLYFAVFEKEFKKKYKVGITFAVPFTKEFTYSGIKTYGSDFYSNTNSKVKLSGCLTMLRFNYVFNKGKEIKKLDRNIEMEKENGNKSM
jgi:hypothetical protein